MIEYKLMYCPQCATRQYFEKRFEKTFESICIEIYSCRRCSDIKVETRRKPSKHSLEGEQIKNIAESI